MAIVAVARDLYDLRERLGRITVGATFEGEPVTAEQLRAAGAMTVLLKETIKPNLVQTLEGQPAFVHCGPFANIAHGNNSLVADRVALKLGDVVVTESGFGSDMGMEKFFDIVCRVGGLRPSAVVLVATVKALKHHGGEPDGGAAAIERGAANMVRHLGIIREFGLNAVVAVNRFPGDADEEIELVRELALANGAFAAEVERGGRARRRGRGRARRGGRRRDRAAERVRARLLARGARSRRRSRRSRGASTARTGSCSRRRRRRRSRQFEAAGFDRLPICMAKTHLSLSHDATLTNAPTGFTVTIRDIRAYTGAGWLVALCGDMQTMPGLGQDAGRVQRRHRRRGADGWTLLRTRSTVQSCTVVR